MPLLENHIAVVTGAASGIGRAIAAGYAKEGAQVVLLDMNEKAAGEAAREIRCAGGKAESFVLDAKDPDITATYPGHETSGQKEGLHRGEKPA